MMKKIKNILNKIKEIINKMGLIQQLVVIIGIVFIVITVMIGILLPKTLTPLYEENLYNYLKQSNRLLNGEDNTNLTDIAYVFVTSSGVMISHNYDELIEIDIDDLARYITNDTGKIKYNGETYYYARSYMALEYRITITDSEYIKSMKRKISFGIFPIILGTLVLVIGVLLIWSTILVEKIKKLVEKVKNINNKNYNHKFKFNNIDEVFELEEAIEDMRVDIETTEKYKQDMFQNISHDLKTPISVIKSYIEAINDGVKEPQEGLDVICEQTNKLEEKVKSLLYLNKLDYYIDNELDEFGNVKIASLIEKSVEKFKVSREDIEWNLDLDKSTMLGNRDMWEVVIDNILENAIRYAKSEIKITLKRHKLTFYNDGDNIGKDIIKDIFCPYKKGIKGNFGLGLSIVKKTVELFGYNITISNEKDRVAFFIK